MLLCLWELNELLAKRGGGERLLHADSPVPRDDSDSGEMGTHSFRHSTAPSTQSKNDAVVGGVDQCRILLKKTETEGLWGKPTKVGKTKRA